MAAAELLQLTGKKCSKHSLSLSLCLSLSLAQLQLAAGFGVEVRAVAITGNWGNELLVT